MSMKRDFALMPEVMSVVNKSFRDFHVSFYNIKYVSRKDVTDVKHHHVRYASKRTTKIILKGMTDGWR